MEELNTGANGVLNGRAGVRLTRGSIGALLGAASGVLNAGLNGGINAGASAGAGLMRDTTKTLQVAPSDPLNACWS